MIEFERITLFDMPIDVCTTQEAIDFIRTRADDTITIYTPNLEHLVLFQRDSRFREAYLNSTLNLVDGMPLVWLSKLKQRPLSERVNGTNFMIRVFLEFRGLRYFLVGGASTPRAVEKLSERYPDIDFVGYYVPPYYNGEFPEHEIDIIREKIIASGANFVLVGVGAPKQEIVIYELKHGLNLRAIMGVGGAIDFFGSEIKRAPLVLQNMGLEWLYRITQEPKRMTKRYSWQLYQFVIIVGKEILHRLRLG